jgi:hypothetical protein
MLKFAVTAAALAAVALGASARASGATFTEDFAADPLAGGWRVFGDASLFGWNATNQHLEVTWDSSRSNSYFRRPLGTVLSRSDDFSLSFDLTLRDVAGGVDPEKPFAFQLAVGFHRAADADRADFIRGTGTDSPNLVEFDYFPDTGFGATVWTACISAANEFATNGHAYPLEMAPGDLFHVALDYIASESRLVTTMTRNGEPFGPIPDGWLMPDFSDFRVDHVSVSSYSDAGQWPGWGGSILAHGVLDNLVVTTPPPPVTNVSGGFHQGVWQVIFRSQTNWMYSLEATTDFRSWTTAALAAGDGGGLVLQDTNASPARFYRVKADKP